MLKERITPWDLDTIGAVRLEMGEYSRQPVRIVRISLYLDMKALNSQIYRRLRGLVDSSDRLTYNIFSRRKTLVSRRKQSVYDGLAELLP